MIIIGEKLNSTNKAAKAAIESLDAVFVHDMARKQLDAGASYIDLNAGMFVEGEPEKLEWLVKTAQEAVDAPLSIDSPNPEAIERALKITASKPIINSITLEKERYDSILPLVLEYGTRVIALCMDDSGMPETTEERVAIADKLITGLTAKGIDISDIFIDPMIRPVSTGSHYGTVALETIRSVRTKFPGVHITCGLSNISFGLPARKILNQAFLIAAMTCGLDSAILDPLDKRLMAYIYAAEALLGNDDFCMNYLEKYREGLIDLP
ncbi:MAG: methyltetrahydrofolate cobalamin methyltransferase [Acetivibrionales bacterium]|nr:methyltetrahydrofolate cobalamin methyltransferase [Bacillota bacterium]NLP07358.1 methyltetrahydrofolate cobalamin methyltransferase [Clostridiaceae bacterium]HOA54046.1 methyltetrahydrofolate cobalamin methyltransferase [Clostridiales bacterium]HPZ05916.1 methyltetrahydrofolate cobalamin methyltransferase [Clostridiales bacterium]HQD30218.1 methyltetrahydrofolate cobalamin methyltransferase [Clostridiales bacterium]